MARLRKVDAEAIMSAIDSPELIRVLTSALQYVLESTNEWSSLVVESVRSVGWTTERVADLLALQADALIELAIELNERRTV
jgi:hypothetical protein